MREDILKLVLLNRWKTGVCAACFDELAEKGGIAYSFEDLQAMSWSDRGAPPRRGSKEAIAERGAGGLSSGKRDVL